jgi:hypothetical protein
MLLTLHSVILVAICLVFHFYEKPNTFSLAIPLLENSARKTSTVDDSDEEFKKRVQQNLLGDEYKSLVSSHTYLQEKPQFQGEYRDDEIFNDLAIGIGPKAWATMPNCQFYIQRKGVCDPFSAYSPCRYCKDKSLKVLGLPKCPKDDSLIPRLQGKFHWALKPHRIKKKLYIYYLCVIESGPSVEKNNDTSINSLDPYQISYTSGALLSFSLFFTSLFIFLFF